MPTGSPVEWSDAGPGHRSALQSFTCAEPARAVWHRRRREHLHPSPWSLAVQSHIRGLRPPLAPAEHLLLGHVHGELVAVSHFGWTDDRDQLVVFALATTIAQRGSGVGSATIAVTLAALRGARDSSGVGCGAFARIDRRNTVSQLAFARAGFIRLQPDALDPHLEYWVHDLLGDDASRAPHGGTMVP